MVWTSSRCNQRATLHFTQFHSLHIISNVQLNSGVEECTTYSKSQPRSGGGVDAKICLWCTYVPDIHQVLARRPASCWVIRFPVCWKWGKWPFKTLRRGWLETSTWLQESKNSAGGLTTQRSRTASIGQPLSVWKTGKVVLSYQIEF